MQGFKPAELGAAHGGAVRGGVVVGSGEMVEAVGDIERQFPMDSVVLRAFSQGALDVHQQIAGGAFFAGNGFATEADDIGWMVFSEKLTVGLCDAVVVRKNQSDFLPDGIRIGGLNALGELTGQSANRRQIQPVFPLLVPYGCFHLLGRLRGRGACW